MSRVRPASPEAEEPISGPAAPLRRQIYSQRPAMARVYRDFGVDTRAAAELSPRRVELVRPRIAFRNQWRTRMSVRFRYADGVEDGLTEELVCSLEKPEGAPDQGERAAPAFADLMATDHFAVDDAAFERLREHYDEGEIMEPCLHCANYIDFGRMAMSSTWSRTCRRASRGPAASPPGARKMSRSSDVVLARK